MSNYQPRTYSDMQPFTVDDKNREAQNMQYLFENSIRGRHWVNGNKNDKGLKIMSGIIGMPRTKSYWTYKPVYFGSYFTPGCIPVVNLTHASNPSGATVAVRGLTTLLPDHNGFVAVVVRDTGATSPILANTHAIHWMALGY